MVPLFFILAVVFVVVGFTDNPISDYTVRQFEGLFTMNESSSAYLRVLRGFDIYSQLGPLEEIFGIGLGTYRSYYATGALYVFDGETEYMSSLSYLFVSTGLIGFIIYTYSLIYNSRNRGIAARILAIWIMVSFSSSSLLNTPIYLLTYLFLLHYRDIRG